MKSKRFVMTFPSDATTKTITYDLIKKFDIMVNIVKANVSPGEIGHLVIEMTAPAMYLKTAWTISNKTILNVNRSIRK